MRGRAATSAAPSFAGLNPGRAYQNAECESKTHAAVIVPAGFKTEQTDFHSPSSLWRATCAEIAPNTSV